MDFESIVKKNGILCICGLAVLVGSFTVFVKAGSVSGTRLWVGIVFSIAVFLACLLEITILPRVRNGTTDRSRMYAEVAWVWIIPLLIGIILGQLTTGQ